MDVDLVLDELILVCFLVVIATWERRKVRFILGRR